MTHDAQIEAILFWKGEAMTLKEIAQALSLSEEEVREGIEILEKRLVGGIRLMRLSDAYELRTAPDMGPVIEKLVKDELDKDIGRAGLETLTLVLYAGPLTRAKIDYVRGVNSQAALRALSVRGLVDKKEEGRSYIYAPSLELLAHLGVTRVEDLPDYQELRREIDIFSARDTVAQDLGGDTKEQSSV